MKKLIVFDWNGTLLSDTVASWKAGNACLEFYGAKPITLGRYRETFHFPVIHFYKLNGIDTDTVLARKAEANKVFQTAYEALAANSRTRGGARELLAGLQARNIPSIILSNYVTDKIAAQLKRLRIDNFFRDISAHDDGMKILETTSKAERLAAYLKTHKQDPAETIIIGDSDEEPAIARQLGLTSIGLTDGYISRKRLAGAKPDHIVNSLSEIAGLIG